MRYIRLYVDQEHFKRKEYLIEKSYSTWAEKKEIEKDLVGIKIIHPYSVIIDSKK